MAPTINHKTLGITLGAADW